MSGVGDRERATQDRVVKLFAEQLHYEYLGNWTDREGNSSIEEGLLRKYLVTKGYGEVQISRALSKLRSAANNYGESLYTNNKNVYEFLRYGIEVKENPDDKYERVWPIDWDNPQDNDFALAEEVTVLGEHSKRPDVVLYVNGIALGVIELKRSTVSVGDGIRQNIVNQRGEFIQPFFSAIQFIFAGNDTEGLRYGTIGTPEKFYLRWKEESDVENVLDRYLLKLCDKHRFLEILSDFTVYDGGIKKLPRAHQYFGVKAAQEHVKRKEGGIIWHTQGSGKSLVMVYLAKWILETDPNARVVVITDRDELDKQIEGVFRDTGEQPFRTRSGRQLMEKLGESLPRLLCSLVHKFHGRGRDDFEAFIEELQSGPSKTVGELYVFVDECHRTQSGKLHKVMKAMLQNAVFIGFTGTPLLKQDRKTSLEVFGKYIHTYKFNEAVKDDVVRDLVYHARDIDQNITAQDKIDAWFDAKTRGLNDFQKSELKKKWGTMQRLLSSRSRLEKVVADIVFDFSVKPRLATGYGNAMLVARSIYEACRYFELFNREGFKGKCALITSYNPSTRDIVHEDTGENTETEKEFIYNTYVELLRQKPWDSTENYEEEAKEKFIKEPANMRLLIVVNKLLTGFDAPPCTYLYIDKSMQDHDLFQAICRVNRNDTEDKLFGYIVDYRDLFRKVEDAIAVYTSDLSFDDFEREDVEILIKDRLEIGRKRLDEAIEEFELLCEPVEPPKDSLAYIRYFCGNPEIEDDLKEREASRTALYKAIVALIRAYSGVSADMLEAGYTAEQVEEISRKVDFSLKLREEIRKASGETLDLKTYEADMRALIDRFIQADESRRIDPFGDQTLLEIIVDSGISDAIQRLPEGIKKNQEAVAETIENNVRRTIIREHLIDPAYFEKMSKLLDGLIAERKASALNYQEYLKRIAELAKRVSTVGQDELPEQIKTKAQRAIYNNLSENAEMAVQMDEEIRSVKKADFRGNLTKENEIKAVIWEFVKNEHEVERIFAIVKQQDEY